MIRDLAKKGYKDTLKTKIKEREEKLLSKKELSEGEFKSAVKKIKKIVSASALMYIMSLEDLATRREVNVAGERGPVDEFEFRELKNKLISIISELPEEQRKVVNLFFNKGLKQRQISKQLGLSRPKVCRILARATKYLQHKIKAKGH